VGPLITAFILINIKPGATLGSGAAAHSAEMPFVPNFPAGSVCPRDPLRLRHDLAPI